MTDLVYTPPGIYIDENASPVPNIGQVVALPPSRVAIVGPSIGYRSNTETVRLGATAVTLDARGIDTAANFVVTSLSGVVYQGGGQDYTLETTGTPATEAVTTIERESGGLIPLDEVVYVSYRYSDTDFFQPYFSTDWDDIQTRFGAALNTAGAITSPLSLAAKIVMEQGARELILVPTTGTTATVSTAELKAAYNKLNARTDVGIVVPLPVGATGTTALPGDTTLIGTDLAVHVSEATASGLYRIGVLGYETSVDRPHEDIAAAINSSRVVLAYPNVMSWYNGYTNRVSEIAGYYLAAAYAGVIASQAPQQPLTAKSIASFNRIPARIATGMTPSAKNALSGGGVSVTEQRSDGRLVVRHGVSTNMSGVLTREISITRAKDALLRLIYQALDLSGIVGDAATNDSPVQIRSIVDGALAQAVGGRIIVGYSNLAVKTSDGDPTTLQVKFAYSPAYPINKISVSFAINTQTGTLQEA
jgi:hypothetical protein